MAATLTVLRTVEAGEFALDHLTITMDATYPAGGEAIDAVGDIGYLTVWFSGPSTTGYIGKWDATNQKIKVFYADNNNAADGPLIENATADISAEIFDGVGLRLK
jgi:hypothetical protein